MRNTQASNDMSNSAVNSGAIPLPIPLPADPVEFIHIVDIYLIFGVEGAFSRTKTHFSPAGRGNHRGTTTGRNT
jgi:hypothetical protein